ncbi:MAG: MBL fold metallo-hydrolase [Gemmatimonadaceae bacterium]|nr:MBL fold metallo-hydrolase [Gemmatimonadaceae bacterium]
MLRTIRHDGVTEFRFASLASRAIGYAVSAFLTDDEVLVDTAFPGARRDLVRALRGRAPRGVLVTHHHEDHAGNVAHLAHGGVPMHLAPATEEALRRFGPMGLYRRFTWRSMGPLTTPIVPFDPGRYALVPTPGHTADHHVVWDAATRTLFAGDLFLGVKVRISHHDEDPYAAFLDEIAQRLRAGHDDARILRELLGGESATGIASRGEYSRASTIAAVRRRIGAPA